MKTKWTGREGTRNKEGEKTHKENRRNLIAKEDYKRSKVKEEITIEKEMSERSREKSSEKDSFDKGKEREKNKNKERGKTSREEKKSQKIKSGEVTEEWMLTKGRAWRIHFTRRGRKKEKSRHNSLKSNCWQTFKNNSNRNQLMIWSNCSAPRTRLRQRSLPSVLVSVMILGRRRLLS